jgi:hypothetical protein
MAGIEQGSGALSQSITEFLSGATDAQQFATALQRLRGTIASAQFDEFAEQVEDAATELVGAELGAERTANQLEARRFRQKRAQPRKDATTSPGPRRAFNGVFWRGSPAATI